MSIVRLTNQVALVSMLILIYWVFIYVSIEVFGFKVFRENITQVFMFSILGIFSILVGAIILNIITSVPTLNRINSIA